MQSIIDVTRSIEINEAGEADHPAKLQWKQLQSPKEKTLGEEAFFLAFAKVRQTDPYLDLNFRDIQIISFLNVFKLITPFPKQGDNSDSENW